MNNTFIFRMGIAIAFLSLGCTKDNTMSPGIDSDEVQAVSAQNGGGATQVFGIGYYATTGECEPMMEGASYVIKMTGDIEGCLYAFIDDYECSPSGTYREEGREYFVGTYNGKTGTFWTTYKFEAKFEGCSIDGAPLGAEIFGRCQHPIVNGSGEGGFEGVKGQINFKDDVQAGNFPYRAHLQF